jgi:transcription elongation GreA/GreB family factor
VSRSGVFGSEEKNVPDVPAARPVSARPNLVTSAGLAQLRASETELVRRREQMMLAGHDPVQDDEIRLVDRDLVYVRARLGSAVLVETHTAGQVGFGATVTVREDQGGEQQTWTVVGEDEADPDRGKISYASPLAAALEGVRTGQTVRFRRPLGDVDLTVLAVRYDAG